MPSLALWLMTALVMGTGFFLSWAIAGALLVLMLAQVARPLDFMTSFLIVVGGASLVYNEGGGLTYQLGLLSVGILVMLGCYLLATRERALSIVRTPLTWPILAYVGFSIANAARGILTGYSPKWVNLEFLPALALGTAILVANGFEPRKHLRQTTVALIVLSFAPTFRGYYMYWIVRTHTTGLYSMATPGIVGLLIINLALRARTRLAALGWIAVSLPLFLDQLISFGRGLWTGCIAGLLASGLIYAGFGRGSGQRWGRVGLVLGSLVGLGLIGAIQAAVVFQQGSLLQDVFARFTSITSTKAGIETMSTVIRLYEYLRVVAMIQHSPWVGYGLGFTFTLKQPWAHHIGIQWEIHQNYLLVWVKQGIGGLALFLWLLGTAIVWGAMQARRRTDLWESAWYATASTATILLSVFSLTNYPFDTVNETFLLAMLWGGAMAMARSGSLLTLRWSTVPARSQLAEIPDRALRETFPRQDR